MKAKAKGSVQRLTCHHSPRSLQPHHVQHPLLHTHVHLHGLRMSIVDMTEHRLVITGSSPQHLVDTSSKDHIEKGMLPVHNLEILTSAYWISIALIISIHIYTDDVSR